MEEDIEALKSLLSLRDKELQSLNDALLKAREDLKSAQRKLEELHSSTSWRMTISLRPNRRLPKQVACRKMKNRFG